jgi:hypothetical protein
VVVRKASFQVRVGQGEGGLGRVRRRRHVRSYRFGPYASWWRPQKGFAATQARSSPCTPGTSAQVRQRWPQGSGRTRHGARPASCAWRSSTRSRSGMSNLSGCCLREGQGARGKGRREEHGVGRPARQARGHRRGRPGEGGTYCRWCRWHRSEGMSPEPAGVASRYAGTHARSFRRAHATEGVDCTVFAARPSPTQQASAASAATPQQGTKIGKVKRPKCLLRPGSRKR